MKSIITIRIFSVVTLFSLVNLACLNSGGVYENTDRNIPGNIKVNQIGYLVDQHKYFWLSNIDINYQDQWFLVKEPTGQEVLSGVITTNGFYDPLSYDVVKRIDFSQFTTPGTYYIKVRNLGRSHSFIISDSIFNDVFHTVVRSFYYQRSGMELSPENAGAWSRPAAHTNDAYLYSGCEDNRIITEAFIKSTGGWYDAGDFGKKIVPASAALYSFFRLFELFHDKFNNVMLNIPESSNTIPDVLDEVKYELDWFLTMQREDGAVHHLITTPKFHFDMPHTDPQIRYIVPVSTAATADFCAVMAMATKIFRAYDPLFAETCLQAAKKAWGFLENHDTIVPPGGYHDPPCINGTGTYEDSDDRDERLWAAAEMYCITGEEKYKTFFENNYTLWSPCITYPNGWQDVHNNGMFTYVFCTLNNGVNLIRDKIKKEIIEYSNKIVNTSFSTGYGIALKESDFYWGSNALVLNYALELLLANELVNGDPYVAAALDHLNYILGINALGKCFVSGIGGNGVIDPLQAASPYDGLAEPVPGFVVGGPNRYSDTFDIPLNTYIAGCHPSPAKAYLDDHGSYSSNEVALNYTAPLVFITGYFYNTNPLY